MVNKFVNSSGQWSFVGIVLCWSLAILFALFILQNCDSINQLLNYSIFLLKGQWAANQALTKKEWAAPTIGQPSQIGTCSLYCRQVRTITRTMRKCGTAAHQLGRSILYTQTLSVNIYCLFVFHDNTGIPPRPRPPPAPPTPARLPAAGSQANLVVRNVAKEGFKVIASEIK